ncbi:MAG: ADP-ribosylglycohydrolase family protein [Actinomycetota bacterium]
MSDAWKDRAVGSVLGLALGDALGAPFEFTRADAIPDPVPAFERPWMGFPPGTTTDDTAMARNLTRSLAERAGLDAADVLSRHAGWLRTEPPDVGTLTRQVLSRVQPGLPEDAAAREVWERRGPEVSAGNGSVMYCGPLGVAYAHRPNLLHELAPALSAITHWDERCRTAVTAVTLAAAAFVRGDTVLEAVQGALVAVEDREGAEELEFLVEAAGTQRRIDGPDMGFCLFTAGVAMQAALRDDEDFEASLRRVVALGGDTDTNAAVAGALVGARVGRAGLPAAWLDLLADRAEIESEASALLPLAAIDR